MRKALSRDVKKKSVIPLTHPVRPEEIDWVYIMIMYIVKDLIWNKWFMRSIRFLIHTVNK